MKLAADKLPLLLIAGLFLFAYQATLLTLVQYWSANDMYSYAFLVPPIAAVLIWLKREDLGRMPPQPAFFSGGALTFAGLLLLLAGTRASVNLVEELSLVVTISGLVLLLCGWRAFRTLAFPIAYLLAAIPVWELLTTRLHPYFQSSSADIGVAILRLASVPVHREGVFLQLPHATLEVAEACSGVNYLIAVLCLGIPLTQLFINSWGKRLLVVLTAVAIAVLSNGLRVAIVSLFAYHGVLGADGDIHGPFAVARSLLVSGVGFVALFALVGRFADKHPKAAASPTRHAARQAAGRSAERRRLFAAAVAVLLFSTFMAFDRLYAVETVPLNVELRHLPERLGPWQARFPGSFANDLEALPFDGKLSRNYQGPDGTELNVFVGYLDRQVQGRELAGYNLRNALGRSSLSPDRFQAVRWYAVHDAWTADDYLVKLYTAWNAIVHARSNGAIIVVTARTGAAARRHAVDFISRFRASAPALIPNE